MAILVQLGHEAFQQRQLAALFPQFLWAGVHDGAIHASSDQVRVVAVLAHLHEDVVEAADDVGPVQALLD